MTCSKSTLTQRREKRYGTRTQRSRSYINVSLSSYLDMVLSDSMLGWVRTTSEPLMLWAGDSATRRLWAWTSTKTNDWNKHKQKNKKNYSYIVLNGKSDLSGAHHDHFHSLSDGVGFVNLLFLQNTSEMTELPDGSTLSTLARQLEDRTQDQINITSHLCKHTLMFSSSHLQHQRHAGGEKRHEHKVIGQNWHAAEAAHDLQLTHTWNQTGSDDEWDRKYCCVDESHGHWWILPDMVPTPITRHSTTASSVNVGPNMAIPWAMFSLTSSCGSHDQSEPAELKHQKNKVGCPF